MCYNRIGLYVDVINIACVWFSVLRRSGLPLCVVVTFKIPRPNETDVMLWGKLYRYFLPRTVSMELVLEVDYVFFYLLQHYPSLC